MRLETDGEKLVLMLIDQLQDSLEEARRERDELQRRLTKIELETAQSGAASDVGIAAQAALKQALGDCQSALAKAEDRRVVGMGLLRRVRANPVASFFLSTAFTQEVDDFLLEHKHDGP